MTTDYKKLQEIEEELIHCGKDSYSNKQKNKYSGYLNTWFNVKYDPPYTLTKEIDVHVFIFKFKRDYSFHSKGKPTHKEKIELIKNKKYTYPLWVYGCSFMFCSIYVDYVYDCRFRWSTGDDDSGFDFDFPIEYLDKVKSFIEENRKSTNFHFRLVDFIEENNFKRQ